MDWCHRDGTLKREVMREPHKYIYPVGGCFVAWDEKAGALLFTGVLTARDIVAVRTGQGFWVKERCFYIFQTKWT